MKEIPYVHLIQESKNPGGEYIPAQQQCNTNNILNHCEWFMVFWTILNGFENISEQLEILATGRSENCPL